ncbi:MAG: hypothetical protein SYNGOMJ08_00033 [Candidatus Syntrophoarchaeum sp. GoM_oil]|nr:MAG: hypothetical protein SYNGOMJ08_00033 [Candidatus Syntrophoarchaeum sp. GoM_oil]
MRCLLFDPFSGAAGDMILASLIDLGADLEKIRGAVGSVCGDRVEIKVSDVKRQGIAAKHLVVEVEDHENRSYPEIVSLLKDGGLDKDLLNLALSIFDRIAEAEARVHGVDPEDLIFHEVGQLDAIADVVGSVAAILDLDVKVVSTKISVGGGFVQHHDHGMLPVPAPATLEILRSSTLIWAGGPIDEELLTPTGAAILSEFVEKTFKQFPPVKLHRIGYGAGSKDLDIANVLRALLCDLEERRLAPDAVEVLETTVDDVTGEVLGALIDSLMKSGALDASIIPVVMKKGRPGHIIQVIIHPEDAERIAVEIMRTTGTLGVRVMPVRHRLILKRRIEQVKICIEGVEFEARVKVATDLLGEVINISPEFEDCRKIAVEVKTSIREVLRLVESEGMHRFG